MEELIKELKNEIMLLRTDILLISYDVSKLREQLDRLEGAYSQPQESIGIAPNTPPPDFITEELM